MKNIDIKLYDINSSELNELIDNSKVELKNKNEDYRNLQNQIFKIINSCPNISDLIEGNEVQSLNTEDCINLQKLILLYLKITTYEDREIFFLGARENYYYFKNIGIISK